jgi:hypothetical protein
MKNLVIQIVLFLKLAENMIESYEHHMRMNHQGNIYLSSIEVKETSCYDEKCYNSINDVYNSPLVECSYL